MNSGRKVNNITKQLPKNYAAAYICYNVENTLEINDKKNQLVSFSGINAFLTQ